MADLSKHNIAKHVAEIVHHGDKLILPEKMKLDDAIDLLKRRKTYLDEEVAIHETFPVFPQDGAHAFDQVLTKKYGWSPAEATPSFFGPNPPKMLTIAVGYKQVKKVPWGRFSIPGVEGFVECGVSRKDGRIVFALSARVLRRDEPTVNGLFDMLREELLERSIFRGKAFKVRFKSDDGDTLDMPEPEFIDTTDIDEDMLIYSAPVMEAVRTNLFTPIRRVLDCVANKIPVKRGVLLGGPYGTGKTLAAKLASKYAVENGVTYLYVPRADELAEAVSFAKLYADPACVIFCEDIDRATDGERSEQMDDLLNIIDGIDTKSANLIVVLTSNHMENINPAMLRPGRLDAVINVEPPDAEAVERLIRYYGAKAIAKDDDLSAPAAALAGRIPAVIAEVVKRAKLAQLSFQEPGTIVTNITAEALLNAAVSMNGQLDLLYKDRTKAEPTVDSCIKGMLVDILNNGSLGSIETQVKEIHEQVV